MIAFRLLDAVRTRGGRRAEGTERGKRERRRREGAVPARIAASASPGSGPSAPPLRGSGCPPGSGRTASPNGGGRAGPPEVVRQAPTIAEANGTTAAAPL
eukprot:1190005-Prorocentrum_minimum.AAC.1